MLGTVAPVGKRSFLRYCHIFYEISITTQNLFNTTGWERNHSLRTSALSVYNQFISPFDAVSEKLTLLFGETLRYI